MTRNRTELDRHHRDPVGAFVNSLPGPMLGAFVGAAYLGLAQFVLWLNDPVNLGAGFWPAAGLSLALLLLLPRRRWVWVLGAVAVAEMGGDLIHGYPADAAAFWTAGNVIEPLVGALLVTRFSSADGTLAPLSKLMGFLMLGVIVAPLVGATVGSLGTILFLDMPAFEVWPKYFAGDALGVLVIAPMLLTWRDAADATAWRERFLVGTGLTIVTVLVFRNWDGLWDVTLPYLILPFIIWASLRFGMRGAALAGFVVANVANWATATHYGPFALEAEHAVTLLQIFLGITIATGLMVAALVNDLRSGRETEKALATHNDELNSALEELGRSQLKIRKLEGILPICMSCKAVRSDDDRNWVPLDRYLAGAKAVSLSHTYCPECMDDELQRIASPSED